MQKHGVVVQGETPIQDVILEKEFILKTLTL
jgi:hypothetical protein